MPLKERLVAFAPLLVLSLLTGVGAVSGLRAGGPPTINAAGWPYVVRELIEAPGVRFTYERSSCSPEVEPRCAGSESRIHENGVLHLKDRSSDSVRTYSSDQPVDELSREIAIRTNGDEEYVRLDSCWVWAPGGTVTSAVVAVLASASYSGAEPDERAGWVAAPATAILSLLGYPEPMWEHSGFPDALRSALPSINLPVAWSVEDGEVSLRVEGSEVAAELAHKGYPDELVQARLRNLVATWSGAILADKPMVPAAEPAC